MSSIDSALPEELTAAADRRGGERLSKDVIFELLKNRRRREVLQYLLAQDGTVTLGELAEQIAAWENDTDVNGLNSDQRKRVYVALYQTHLPKMDEAGIIDYDQDRGLIELADNADLLMMYLDRDAHKQDRWDRWYALLGVVAIAVLGLATFGPGPLAAAPIGWLAGIIVASFVLLSTVHTVVNRQRERGIEGKLSRIE